MTPEFLNFSSHSTTLPLGSRVFLKSRTCQLGQVFTELREGLRGEEEEQEREREREKEREGECVCTHSPEVVVG